ncbi:MAG: sensor histidine kinase [Pseudomonadota bacterium]
MSANVDIEPEQDAGNGRKGWLAFNLVYLAIFFTGWIWQTPGRNDIIAAAIAIAVFLPVFFNAYEGSAPRFVANAAVMEGIAWAMAPFAGIHGVFHVYACVQCAFQRPKRRALLLIGAFSLAYAAYGALFIEPWFVMGFDLMFGAIIGVACTAAADGIERERMLRRSRVLERQRATLAERERIAHDLHDLLGQTLTTVALKAEVASKLIDRDPVRAKAEFEDVAGTARKALAEIRAAVYDMTATSVENEIALARQALNAAGVELDVTSDLPPLAPPVGKALGLTIREATTNIVRHSGADAARIVIGQEGAQLSLTVADNGHGGSNAPSEGSGLAGLRQRVAALGGETNIEHDGGMRIRISLPIDTTATGKAT